MKKIIFLAALLFQSVQAQGFDMLSIRMGGALAALGSGGSARPGTLEGLFQNPASTADLKGINILLSINPYLGMTLWSGASTFSLPSGLTLGASAYGLLYGEFGGEVKLDGSKIADAKDFVAGLTASLSLQRALKLSFGLDLGVTGRVSREYLDQSGMTALLADAGALFTTPAFLKFHTLSLGASIRHLGGGFADGADTAFQLPSSLSLGAAYKIKITGLAVTALADTELAFSGSPTTSLGMELGFLQTIAVRAGYVFGDTTRGLTLGGGGRLSLNNCDATIDYSLIPFGDLGIQHNIQFTFSFGRVLEKPDLTAKPTANVSEKKETPASLIGVLAGINIFEEVQQALKGTRWSNEKFSEEALLRAENGFSWTQADLSVCSRLASQLAVSKLLVILSDSEIGGKIFVFDAKKTKIEKERSFSLPLEKEKQTPALQAELDALKL